MAVRTREGSRGAGIGSRPTRSELQEVVDATRKRLRVPGAAVGVIYGGRELVAVSGVTSVDDPLPVDDNTLFMIGSTTKTFTATALMQLVDQGRVTLDDPVVKHLPRFRLKDPRATRTLTLRHLLTHTGGWDGDIDLDTGWGDDALARFADAMRDQPQQVPVGTTWVYNNAGFCVAGRIIEVVTGTPYERAITELVLAPLAMNTSFFSPVDAVTRRFAVGHVSSNGSKPSVAHVWGVARAIAPAGGIVSTIRDQLAYARFQLGDGRGAGGKRVLKARTLRQMHSPQFPAGNFADSVGFSWMIRDLGGVRTVAHGGNVSNLQLSSFLMVPERGFAVTILTNSTTGGALGSEVEKWALKRFLTVAESAPELLEPEQVDLAEYAGVYSSQLRDLSVSVKGAVLALTPRFNIKLEDVPEPERELVRKLIAQRPQPLELGFYAPDRAVVVSDDATGTRAEFIRGTDGTVRWLRWGGRLSARQ